MRTKIVRRCPAYQKCGRWGGISRALVTTLFRSGCDDVRGEAPSGDFNPIEHDERMTKTAWKGSRAGPLVDSDITLGHHLESCYPETPSWDESSVGFRQNLRSCAQPELFVVRPPFDARRSVQTRLVIDLYAIEHNSNPPLRWHQHGICAFDDCDRRQRGLEHLPRDASNGAEERGWPVRGGHHKSR